MSLSHPITITCPVCQHQQAFTARQSINVTLDPELKKKLLDRSLVTFHCEKCSHTADVDQELLYHDMDRYVMILLGRQDPGDLALPEPISQKIQSQYSQRLVGSINEMIEKALILDADLDDRAVEIFKVAFLANIDEAQRGSNPQLFFSGIYTDDRSEERIEFALVNEAGSRVMSVSCEQAYYRFVSEFCKSLPTVVSECGQWLRVDREYALNQFEARK